MNQLISNVLMQPKPDATEPLTLIEKLENYRDTQTDFEATFTDAVIDVCIDIVKQHQAESWVSVDERLPDKFWDDDKKYYCRVDTMGRIEFKILVWRYGDWHNLDLSPLGQKGFTVMPKVTHYFELPQPPSEVQE